MSMGVSNQNSKRSFFCECSNFAFVARDTVSLEFIWPGPTPRPGQFFLIKPRRTGVFLGRPISFAGWKPRKLSSAGRTPSFGQIAERRQEERRKIVDRSVKVERRLGDDRRLGGILRFLVTRRGQGSRDIVDMRPGEEAELTGPLGNSWPLADISKGPVALVAGGIGIAPLLPIIPELGKKPCDMYVGFKMDSFGLEHIRARAGNPRATIISSENGFTEGDSKGVRGRITDYFAPSGYSRVFACGPEPMLKIIADVCIAAGVPCFMSMEKHMACGVGACLGCKIKTTRGNLCCCADGPIFNAEEICFET